MKGTATGSRKKAKASSSSAKAEPKKKTSRPVPVERRGPAVPAERRGPVPAVSRQDSFEDVVVGDEVVASLPTPRRLHDPIEDADWRAEVMPVLHFSEWRQLPSWDQARSMTDEQRFDCATPPPLEPILVARDGRDSPATLVPAARIPTTYLRPPKEFRILPILEPLEPGDSPPKSYPPGAAGTTCVSSADDAAVMRAQQERATRAGLPRGWKLDEEAVAGGRTTTRVFLSPDRRLDAARKSTAGGPRQTSELSSSVKSTSIRLIFGRIDCARRVLEARRKSVRVRAH